MAIRRLTLNNLINQLKPWLRLTQPWCISGFVLLLSVLPLQAQEVPEQYIEELRGVWITNVDSDVLFSRESIVEAMDYLADRGFNVVFPVVWNKGYTLHPSEVAYEAFGKRQDTYFATRGRDPLQEIITEAHRRGMEVIPWFEYGFASVYGDATGGHIIQANPHWAARDAQGRIATMASISRSASPFYWMNAIHPEVQQFMIDLMMEVVQNYDVDGIQGDDRLPAMSVNAGYSDYTKQLYASEHNGAAPPSQYNSSAFVQWKADKLTNFAGKLYRTLKQQDSTLIMSFSPSIYSFSLTNYLQDWPNWIDSSYVDILHPQAYRYDVASYKQIIRSMFGQQPYSSQGYLYRSAREMVYPGVLIKAGGAFNDDDYILEAIDFNRQYDLKGEVYFFFEGLDEKNNDLADSLYKYKYQLPAVPPYRKGHLRRPPGIISTPESEAVEVSGDWSKTGNPAGYQGESWKAAPGTAARISYQLDVPTTAWYRVYAWLPNTNDASSEVNYLLTGSKDTTKVQINQASVPKGWVGLGSAHLDQGNRTVVTLDTENVGDGKAVYTDAVMIILDRQKSPTAEVEATIVSRERNEELPGQITLNQNYPNPFNPVTSIPFELKTATNISLDIYDVLGRKVQTLIHNTVYPAGAHQVQFSGSEFSSGLYYYRLRTDETEIIKAMTLIK